MKRKTIIIVILLFTLVLTPINTSAKTLNDLRQELADLQSKKASQDSEKKKTKEEYDSINTRIEEIKREITDGKAKIEESKQKIKELEEQISKKQEEMGELFRFLQTSNGENIYLEYIFGAESFTDFIYRSSIVEQLSRYNDELINEMNDLIEENKNLQIELSNKEIKLQESQAELEEKIDELGSEIENLSTEALSTSKLIEEKLEVIEYYEDAGCSDNQELSSCMAIPPATGFSRPLTTAYVTSDFGYRISPITGQYNTFHSGIDLAVSKGTPVYASAAGVVAAKMYHTSCGGNRLYIHHLINGEEYTTAYCHLLSFNVEVGDVVTEDTIIAYVGGDSSTWYYDKCTTGAHLHFSLSVGWYLGDGYSSYSKYMSDLVNPANYVYFPYHFTSRYY